MSTAPRSTNRPNRPLINRAEARRLFRQLSAEWHSDRQHMPAHLMRDARLAAEPVIIRAAAAGRLTKPRT